MSAVMLKPIVQPTKYIVTCLPEDPDDLGSHVFGLSVEYRGAGRWGVFRGSHCCLGADGTWSWGYRGPDGDREPETDAECDAYNRGQDAWLAEHRFDVETALRLAREAAPLVTVNGITVEQAIAMRSAR